MSIPRIAVILISLLCCAGAARAADGPVMQKPAEVSAYVHAAAPYGQGTLRKLLLKVYDTSLWTDAPTWSMDKTFALAIRYNMNFTNKELVDRSFEEIARVSPLSKDERAAFTPELSKAYHDVHPGDVITAVFLPRHGAVLYYNGKKTGALTDPGFTKKFFDIWLGPGTSEPDLRKQLLALK